MGFSREADISVLITWVGDYNIVGLDYMVCSAAARRELGENQVSRDLNLDPPLQ